MNAVSVIVETQDVDSEERFIREYVVPTIKRLRDDSPYELNFYGRYSTSTSVDGGQVKIVFLGDPDHILAEERDHWESFEYVDEWEVEIEADDWESAEERALAERMARVASKMNVHYFEEFDESPPIGSVSEDRFQTWGIWVLIHFLLNEQGFSPEEEVEILFLALRDRLKRIETEKNFERVDELVSELHDRLNDTRERIGRD